MKSRYRRFPVAAPSSIEISGLCKAFGAVRAVDCVDLRVEPGELRGLLGPNGAGKTTLLRLLFRLVRPDAGRIAISDGVAGFVEEPRFYPYLSGRRTLELLAELDGGTARARVDEALDLVGLTREAGRRVGGYSTGMRQRLGVAAALLSTPRVLLLDEPTTGLDPSGARELRLLLRSLADDGVTVLLSSHDMDEVADICGSVTIMRSGSIVWDGPMERLRAEAPAPEHRLETSDDGRALARAPGDPAVSLRQAGDGGLLVTADRDALDRFVLALAAEGIAVRRLEEVVSSVESMFLSLVEGTSH